MTGQKGVRAVQGEAAEGREEEREEGRVET